MKEFWLTKPECTGCAACSNICPTAAISLEEDECGFSYPIISDLCIDCDRCEEVCFGRLSLPAVNLMPPTYAVNSLDEETRFSSTSGGAFTELARAVLAENGVVFGASYDDRVRIVHSFVEDMDGLASLKQSKYAQSSIGSSFREAKRFLKEGRQVLFCGTPCQISGLKSFIGKNHENLFTIDFICRGVNSPKALDAWVEEIEDRKGTKVERIWFKYKENGWKLSPRCTRMDFSDGSFEVFDQDANLFMCGYLEQNLYMRSSCAQCDFKGDNRRSDITLGDFWGLDEALAEDKGTTLLLINTEKGRSLFDRSRDAMRCNERSFSEIDNGNICFRGSVSINPKSEGFFSDLDHMSFSEALKKNSTRKSLLTRAKGFARRIIG